MTFAYILIALALFGMIVLTVVCILALEHMDKRLRLTHQLINERCAALGAEIDALKGKKYATNITERKERFKHEQKRKNDG